MRLGLRSKIKDFLGNISALQDAAIKLKPREQIFAKAYDEPLWGSAESRSGEGSELGATASLREYLPELFRRLNIKTFLDAPCGDWNWMRLVDLTTVDYVGADVVPNVIANNQAKFSRPGVRFVVADLTKDDLPRADLVMCRDCWIHLSFQDIAAVLENIRRSGATWLLVSNSPHVTSNHNKFTGLDWRHLNLRQAPFHFPSPLGALKDHYPHEPFEITLWKIADLPNIKK